VKSPPGVKSSLRALFGIELGRRRSTGSAGCVSALRRVAGSRCRGVAMCRCLCLSRLSWRRLSNPLLCATPASPAVAPPRDAWVMCSSANHASSVSHALLCSTVSRPPLDDPHRTPRRRRRCRRCHVLWLYLYPSATCDVDRQNAHGVRYMLHRPRLRWSGPRLIDVWDSCPKENLSPSLRIVIYHVGLNAVFLYCYYLLVTCDSCLFSDMD
jgi:hypothetical protein